MELTFRFTRRDDLPHVMPIYQGARKFMAQTGNPNQWINGYPAEENIIADINRGVSYVVETPEREIVAVFSLIFGNDPTYTVIEGEWLHERPYATIHRIASSGKISGIGTVIIKWCATQSRELRADTHSDNKVMQNLLLRNGFVYCGIIHLLDGRPRLAYQLKNA